MTVMDGTTSLAASPNIGLDQQTPCPDVREALRRVYVPQVVLTFLTGKPYRGQRGPRLTPSAHLIAALCSTSCGVGISAAGLRVGGAWLLLLVPGWSMSLHGIRNLRMLIYHQCAHRNMWARPGPDRVLGQVISGLLMVQDFETYSDEHIREHHASRHMTLRDPTVQAMLVSLGLKAGMTRSQMWRKVGGHLISPRFHARFAIARVRSFFHAASPTGRLVAAAGYLGVCAAAFATNWWVPLLVAWFLPVTLFFQVSNTLRLCVKHTFPKAGTSIRKGKDYFAGLTNAIFIGEAPPAMGLSGWQRASAWLRWGLRMTLIHFPSRYLVLTGDTVCHDYHHRHPMAKNWANYIFARQEDVENGNATWPRYREVWGLVPAINHVFDSLAAADPGEFDPSKIQTVSTRALFAAFDD